jgi:AbiV family abortive infection protein
MRPRASRNLAQLDDRRFFPAVAEGLALVEKNLDRLCAATATLQAAGQPHPARVLSLLAEEEAAKYLILLDAVRCPREPQERLSRQLHRLNDHLAKGLYARVCGWRPVTLAELQEYIDREREELYLDGPNDVDWILRNDIIQEREGALYVDYIQRDEGCEWWDPTSTEEWSKAKPLPQSVKLARHFHTAGFSTSEALAAVAELWRAIPLSDDTRCQTILSANHQTLEWLNTLGLLVDQLHDVYQHIIREWQFPMYGLDLSKIEVRAETLRERQREWSPD